jgi:hypothetical protein
MKWKEIAEKYDSSYPEMARILGLDKSYLRKIDEGNEKEPKYMYATKCLMALYLAVKQSTNINRRNDNP